MNHTSYWNIGDKTTTKIAQKDKKRQSFHAIWHITGFNNTNSHIISTEEKNNVHDRKGYTVGPNL